MKLATAISMSQQAVAKWESGGASPDPDMLSKIADYFNVSTDYLLGRESPKMPSSKEDGMGIENLKFALWGHGEVTDAMLDDVRRYAEFVEQRERDSDKS